MNVFENRSGRSLGEERSSLKEREMITAQLLGEVGESSNVLVYQQHPIRCCISVGNTSGYKSIRFVEIPNALEFDTFSCNGIN